MTLLTYAELFRNNGDTTVFLPSVRMNKDNIYPTWKGMKLIECIEKPWGNYISPTFTSRVEEEM